jgi:hypothetical protein
VYPGESSVIIGGGLGFGVGTTASLPLAFAARSEAGEPVAKGLEGKQRDADEDVGVDVARGSGGATCARRPRAPANADIAALLGVPGCDAALQVGEPNDAAGDALAGGMGDTGGCDWYPSAFLRSTGAAFVVSAGFTSAAWMRSEGPPAASAALGDCEKHASVTALLARWTEKRRQHCWMNLAASASFSRKA